jgi:beta-phosphoglucomutase-like phosphatase (HAD superfamily)
VTEALRYDALLFDFDGVIVESVDIKSAAFSTLYAEYGEAVGAAVRAYHAAHGGVSRYEKFRHFDTVLLGLPAPSAVRERELDERFSALVLAAVVAAPLVDGIAAVLDYHLPRIPMYVVSGTPELELATIIERRRLGHYFQRLCGSPTDKVTHVADILATGGHTPERTLVIGDAFTDYAAAVSNGTHFLGRVRSGTPNPFPARVAVVEDFSRCPGCCLNGWGARTDGI